MWRANIACIFTLSNLICGFFAIMLHLMGVAYWDLALLALLGAFFCDGIDGAVARKTNQTSAFGERLDSLSDLVSFGIAPVMFAIAVRPEWNIGLVSVCGLFLVCGAVRLARYDPLEQKKMFKGLPIPMAGLLLASFSVTSSWIPWFEVAPGLLGLLMISDIPFKKVSFRGFDALLPLCLTVSGLLMLLVYHDLAFAMFSFTFTYLVLNLMAAVAIEVRGRIRAHQARAIVAKTQP